MTAGDFDRAVRRLGIPILGVVIGTLADRSTWRIFYDAAATDAQRTQGDALIQTYDASTDTALADEDATAAIDQKDLTAAVRATWEAIAPASRALTLTQLRARAIAIRKTL